MITNDQTQDNQDNTITPEIVTETGLATLEVNFKEVIKGAEGTLVVLEDYEATKKKLEALAKKYEKDIKTLIALPVLNTEQMAKAKAIRAQLREPRLALGKLRTTNTTVWNNAKKIDQERFETLAKITETNEDIIDAKIKGEETRKAEIKKQEEEAEKKRVDDIRKRITDAGIEFERMLSIFKTEDELAQFDEKVKEFSDNLADLMEFEYDGHILLEGDESRDGVLTRRVEITARIDEAKRLAEQQKEQNEKAQELAKKEQELADKQKAIDEENALKQQKIDEAQAKHDRLTNRIAVVEALGFKFNGISLYTHGELVISTNDIAEMLDEPFADLIEEKQCILQDIERAEKQKTHFESLRKSYFEITNTEYKEITNPSVEDVDLIIDEINKAQEPAPVEIPVEAEAPQAEPAPHVDPIKETGKVVVDAIDLALAELKVNLSPDSLTNETVKSFVLEYLKDADNLLGRLKINLHQ